MICLPACLHNATFWSEADVATNLLVAVAYCVLLDGGVRATTRTCARSLTHSLRGRRTGSTSPRKKAEGGKSSRGAMRQKPSPRTDYRGSHENWRLLRVLIQRTCALVAIVLLLSCIVPLPPCYCDCDASFPGVHVHPFRRRRAVQLVLLIHSDAWPGALHARSLARFLSGARTACAIGEATRGPRTYHSTTPSSM